MDLQSPQLNNNDQPKKNWLSAHHLLGYLFLLAAIAAIVSGVYYWQTVRSIPAYEPIVHKDPTANWKTYTNEQYGFSFKYPGDWTYKNDEIFGIVFASPERTKGIEDNDKNCDANPANDVGQGGCIPEFSNFDFYLKPQSNNNIWVDINDPETAKFYEPTQKTINKINWTRYLDLGLFDLAVYVTQYNNNTIEFGTYSGSEEEQLLIKILSTFKFIKDPEVVLAELATYFRNADRKSALSYFAVNDKEVTNEEVLNKLSDTDLKIMADFFEQARFIEQSGGIRVYKGPFKEKDGSISQVEFMMSFTGDEWQVSNW